MSGRPEYARSVEEPGEFDLTAKRSWPLATKIAFITLGAASVLWSGVGYAKEWEAVPTVAYLVAGGIALLVGLLGERVQSIRYDKLVLEFFDTTTERITELAKAPNADGSQLTEAFFDSVATAEAELFGAAASRVDFAGFESSVGSALVQGLSPQGWTVKSSSRAPDLRWDFMLEDGTHRVAVEVKAVANSFAPQLRKQVVGLLLESPQPLDGLLLVILDSSRNRLVAPRLRDMISEETSKRIAVVTWAAGDAPSKLLEAVTGLVAAGP